SLVALIIAGSPVCLFDVLGSGRAFFRSGGTTAPSTATMATPNESNPPKKPIVPPSKPGITPKPTAGVKPSVKPTVPPKPGSTGVKQPGKIGAGKPPAPPKKAAKGGRDSGRDGGRRKFGQVMIDLGFIDED